MCTPTKKADLTFLCKVWLGKITTSNFTFGINMQEELVFKIGLSVEGKTFFSFLKALYQLLAL